MSPQQQFMHQAGIWKSMSLIPLLTSKCSPKIDLDPQARKTVGLHAKQIVLAGFWSTSIYGYQNPSNHCCGISVPINGDTPRNVHQQSNGNSNQNDDRFASSLRYVFATIKDQPSGNTQW